MKTLSMETKIIDIFKIHTGVEMIDIERNFFDLGVNSFELSMIGKDISKQLNKNINILSFYEFPTIRLLSEKLAERDPI
jgi:acyl carrier protein